MEHTTENVERLASDIVADWDMDTLIEYAVVNLTNHYMENEEAFHKEWEDFYE